MQPGPFGVVAWWQLNMAGNAVVALACLALVPLIAVPLYRAHQLRTNRLALACTVVALAFGLQRTLQVAFQVAGLLGDDPRGFAAAQRNSWWLTLTQLAVASLAVYYFVHRRTYTAMMLRAFLFDSFAQQQRIEALEAQQTLNDARAAAERERDEYAGMLQGVLHNSQSIITVKDLDGRYLLVNQPFERATGLSEEDVLGRTDEVLQPVTAERPGVADRPVGQDGHPDVKLLPDDDGELRFDVATFPLRRTDGTVYGTGTIAHDVTEQKRVEVAMTDARDAALAATAAKSAFLATMSHEIRTPMNAVIGMTDLLMGTRLDEQQREFIDTVRSSGDALMAVINDILDFSKIEAGELRLEPVPFNLRDEVESCLDFVVTAAGRKGLDLVCYVSDDCPERVVGDVGRIRQILANLLSNAVKFTETGDVLVVVSVTAASADGLTLELKVTDTGIGIDARSVERLFQPFSQVDDSTTRVYGGTGLGLVISRRLAEAMGGQLAVTSTPGVGSDFVCTVPVARCPDHLGDRTADPAPSALVGSSALLVDDNPTNLRILDLQLSGLGMVCTTVADPQAALALVDAGNTFDIGILDMHMLGMNGIELGDALVRRLGAGTPPLVLLTSVGWLPDGYERSFAAHLAKPTKRAVLRDALAQLLRPGGSADAEVPDDGGVDAEVVGTDDDHTDDRTDDRTENDSAGTSGDPAAGVAALPGPRPPVPAVSVRRSSRRSLQVLLAEDNLVNQRVAQLMLGKLGYQVRTVATGLAAVEALEQERYDVVLMDVQMPTMDGLEATRRIRAEVPVAERPFIVAMTASALVEDRDACVAAGMDSYLSKPVRVRDLELMLAGVPVRGQG